MHEQALEWTRADGAPAAAPLRRVALPDAPAQLWGPVIGFLLVAAALFFAAGYRVQDPLLAAKLALYLACVAIGQAAWRAQERPNAAWAVLALAQAIAIATGGMMLTYAAAALDRPLADAALLRIDRALGYHWIDYALFVHARPWLTGLLRFCYLLIYDLALIVVFTLAATGRYRQINRYLVATAISLALTAAIFALYPALTAWDYLHVDPRIVHHIGFLPEARSGWERDLLEIRARHGFVLANTNGSGLIAFPSYHCIAGLLFVWALWPIRRARLPAGLASALLIAATPLFGGHYLADLLGGAVVTVVSVAAAVAFERYWHARGGDAPGIAAHPSR